MSIYILIDWLFKQVLLNKWCKRKNNVTILELLSESKLPRQAGHKRRWLDLDLSSLVETGTLEGGLFELNVCLRDWYLALDLGLTIFPTFSVGGFSCSLPNNWGDLCILFWLLKQTLFLTSICQGVTDCFYCQWASCGSAVCDVCGHIPAGLQHQQQGGRRPGRQQRHAQGQGAADARRGARWQFQGDAITRRQAAGEKHSQNIHFSLN